jgi:predicted nucleic acid-binding protein
MIFDTDILSMFAKTGRVDLLKKLFPDEKLIITFEVYNELLRAKEAGYDFINDILKQGFRIVNLDSDLIQEYETKKEELRNLHSGELTSILLCKKDGMDFATNDNRAKRYCNDNNVGWLDIVDMLRLCNKKHILNKKEIENLILDIEKYDRTRITKKEEIFSE